MENSFKELIDALKKCKDNCPWTKKQTVESYAHQVADEAQEMMEALEKKDYVNLKEELGDILWDVLMVAHLAEDEGLFKVKGVMDGIVDKIKRRKPYIFEGKNVTIEEARRIWKEVKAKEKSENDISR